MVGGGRWGGGGGGVDVAEPATRRRLAKTLGRGGFRRGFLGLNGCSGGANFR